MSPGHGGGTHGGAIEHRRWKTAGRGDATRLKRRVWAGWICQCELLDYGRAVVLNFTSEAELDGGGGEKEKKMTVAGLAI